MLPKERIIIIASLTILTVTSSGMVFGQIPIKGMTETRALELESLLDSIEGIAKEPPRVFKTKEGYLRFIGAAPSTNFTVEPGKRGTPEQAASAFLEKWRILFVSDSPAVGFDIKRVRNHDSRSYVRYRQTYAGLEVFGAEVIIQVNSTGGVIAAISDIMRDTQLLDTGVVSLEPTIDALTAQNKGTEFLTKQHKNLKFDASAATLMIYSPEVVGNKGAERLVWKAEVGNTGEPLVKELVLIDDHNSEVAFHYSLIYSDMTRQIYDCVSGIWYYENSTWPAGIPDVDQAHDYLGDAYEFYWNHHGRDSYDNAGSNLVAKVRYGKQGSWWYGLAYGNFILSGEDFVSDDTIGHEFTHGVTEHESNLVYANEPGAINESFSDMWGEWIDLTNGAGNDSPDVRWYLFEDNYYGAGSYMKDPPEMEKPDRYQGPFWHELAENPSEENDWGGVHTNSGVGNKLCYLLTDGDSFNGHTISGMGIEKTADLFYECQTHLLTTSADYYDLGNVLQLAAINIIFTQSERYNVEEACRAVEIYSATSRFCIQDSTGVPVAWFDDLGNLVLKGKKQAWKPPEQQGHEFIVENSTGPIVYIDDTGNLYLNGGDVIEHTISPPTSDDEFRVLNSNNAQVAIIRASTSDKNVYLKGILYQNP